MQRLQISLSEILETRREARGLIVNISDVLFDTAKYTLKPGAREKMAKVAGILLAFFIPVAMIHDTFVHAHTGPGRRPRQHEMLALFFYFGVAMFAGWALP